MKLRDATAEDWPDILRIVRAALVDGGSYDWTADTPDEELRGAWMSQPGYRTLLAIGVELPDILGVAKFGPNRAGRGSHLANASFVVAPEAAGRGVGRFLGEHVLELARAAGFAAMQFNAVVETNTRAVALWQSLGFAIIGTVPEAFEHPTAGRVGLHIMHRSL